MNQNFQQMQFNIPFPPVVRALIIGTVSFWIVGQLILDLNLGLIPFGSYLSLVPYQVLIEFKVWQPITYIFLHSTSWTHIGFNMLMLWFLGGELEQRWGGKFFLSYYLFCGVGAALIYSFSLGVYALMTDALIPLRIPVIGASGSVFGLLLAYGLLFGERVIYFMMLIPIKAKYFVMILGGIQIVSMLASGPAGGDVAYLAHLGGLASGFIFLVGWAKFAPIIRNRKEGAKKKRKGKLRLVVDNEKPDKEPKYWN